MNKVIIISEQSKGLAKILNGEKTIEIRKTIPKCKLPIDVYLYCTKDKPHLYFGDLTRQYETDSYKNKWGDELSGKVVAKFTLNKVDELEFCDFWGKQVYLKDIAYSPNDLAKKAALDIDDIVDYGNDKSLYAWHIDNLVIFDKPMELSNFYKDGGHLIGNGYTEYLPPERITKAPQSWQYVYVKGEQK